MADGWQYQQHYYGEHQFPEAHGLALLSSVGLALLSSVALAPL
jgi:hypothetical protein